jgi:hypothetical protein
MAEIVPSRREQLYLWATWTLAVGMSGAAIGALQQVGICEGTFIGLILVGLLLYGGVGLAMAQWLMLRGAVTKAGLWRSASANGWLLAVAVEWRASETVRELLGADREVWDLLAPEQTQFPWLLLVGLALGIAQALLWRRRVGAAWWLPACVAGVILTTLGLASVHEMLAGMRVGACSGFSGARSKP